METITNKSRTIEGEKHIDHRGCLHYFNQLDLQPIKRQYSLEHPDTHIIRAWQGHRFEQKWFQVTSGSFKVVITEPDDWEQPSEDLEYRDYILSAYDGFVLHVPGGLATGFKALEPDSKILVFSDFTLAESALDDYRFPGHLWYKW